MAKVYFYYSAMNAGKSTTLLQSSYNYQERGMRTLVLKPRVDTRDEPGRISSRIGLASDALLFSHLDNLLSVVRDQQQQDGPLDCIFIDEAQFLTKRQVTQLTDVADLLGIPVLAYGLRTDFQGQLFEGSQYLLAWADSLCEIKTICHCGRKATMVLRIDGSGCPVRNGDQVEIGGNERYLSVCRMHHKEGLATRHQPELPFNESS